MDVLTARYLLRHATGDPGLAAGVAGIAAGDVASAAQRLAAVVDERDDPAVRVRAAAYHRLATHLRWNAFPGGGGAGATEVSVRWDGAPSAVDAREDWSALVRGLGDPAVTAEVRAVGGALCALPSLRAIVGHAAARLAPAEVDGQLARALDALAPLRDLDDSGYALVVSADLSRRAGRPEQALQLLRDAAAAYGAAGDDAGLGACHLLRGDWRAAPAGGPEARNLTLVTSAAESSALDWALERTEGDRTGLDVDGATAAYTEAAAAFTAADLARGVAAVTLRRSHLAALAGDHDEAGVLAGRAAAAADACTDRWGAWLSRTHEVLSAVAAGRLDDADATVERVGVWGAGTGSFSYALGLGVLCARTGRDWLHRRTDPRRALACHRLAHTLFVALGAVTDQAQSLVDRGRVLHVIGNLQGAADVDEEALGLLTADRDVPTDAAADNRLRAVSLAQTLYLVHLTRRDAGGMARAAEQLRAQAAGLPADAAADSVEGRLAAAARDVLVQEPVLVPLYRGEQARAAGDRDAADSCYAAALEAVRAGDHADPDHLEAVVLAHWRRYPEASAAFERHLEVVSAPPGLLGRVLARFGPLKAETDVRRRRLHAQAGAFLRTLGAHKAAVAHFEALERGWGPQWWAEEAHPWTLVSDYAVACDGLGEHDRALALHDQAIALVEEGHTRHDPREVPAEAGSQIAAVYLHASRSALRLHELAAAADAADAHTWSERAFADAERGRTRALLDRLATGVALARAAPTQHPAVRRWHETTAARWTRQGVVIAERTSAHPDPDRIAALREEIAGSAQQLAERTAELAKVAPALAATVAIPAAVPDVDEVRAALPAGTALLAYHHTDEELVAWAVTADRVEAQRTPADRLDMAREARAFDQACAAGGDRAGGAALARRLLVPLADVLATVDRLIVVPAEASAVAVHALPWGDAALSASHTVTYLPSVASLRLVDGTGAPAAGRPLVVGDPTNPAWQALPGESPAPAHPRPAATTEAADVAAALGSARLLAGGAATRAAVTGAVATAPVLHVAAPTQVRADAPLLSSVLLADGEALSVYELIGIGLDADLVVLSDCRVEPGGDAPAAGVMLAVARGLLGAGARGVVVNLWPEAARTRCVLMTRFWQLVHDGVRPADALLRAGGQQCPFIFVGR